MLSDTERRVLAVYCLDHAVARCYACRRGYYLTQLGVEVTGRRYYFCPLCRVDFLDDLRLHVLTCPSIAAGLEERIQRSQALMKESDRLCLSSAVLLAESQALARRVLNTKQKARHIPPPPTSD